MAQTPAGPIRRAARAARRLARRGPRRVRYRVDWPPVTPESADETLERLLVENLLGFWDEWVLDPQGGYRLAVDAWGRRRRDSRRWLVTQARTTWFFSRLARSPYGEPRHLDWAAHGRAFLRERMWDTRHGGFFWEVDATGPTDERKHLYGHAFALLALVEFARTADDASSLAMADELFDLIEERARDERFGGYFESHTRDWRRETPGSKSPLGPPAERKTVNTHMHLMPAVGALVEAGRDGAPRERLRELVSILNARGAEHLPDGYADECHRDWSPAPGWTANYGHGVEGAWLSLRAAEVLGEPDRTVLPVCEALWENTLRQGFDHERGGVYNGGEPGLPADDLDKTWWAQGEALVSARVMHRRTGEERYEKAFLRTLDWIVRCQADWKRGDWHRKVRPDGTAGGMKAGPWECPFHQGRALLECLAPRDELSAS